MNHYLFNYQTCTSSSERRSFTPLAAHMIVFFSCLWCAQQQKLEGHIRLQWEAWGSAHSKYWHGYAKLWARISTMASFNRQCYFSMVLCGLELPHCTGALLLFSITQVFIWVGSFFRPASSPHLCASLDILCNKSGWPRIFLHLLIISIIKAIWEKVQCLNSMGVHLSPRSGDEWSIINSLGLSVLFCFLNSVRPRDLLAIYMYPLCNRAALSVRWPEGSVPAYRSANI